MTASLFPMPADIFDYRPERITLTGYRCAMAGYDLGDSSCWDDLWTHVVADADVGIACHIMGSLQYFVRSLRSASDTKVQYFPRACRRICRDECLVLSLLSARQHGADDVRSCCLQRMLGENAGSDAVVVDQAAGVFAKGQSDAGLTLLPVPLSVIQSIPGCASCVRRQVQMLN